MWTRALHTHTHHWKPSYIHWYRCIIKAFCAFVESTAVASVNNWSVSRFPIAFHVPKYNTMQWMTCYHEILTHWQIWYVQNIIRYKHLYVIWMSLVRKFFNEISFLTIKYKLLRCPSEHCSTLWEIEALVCYQQEPKINQDNQQNVNNCIR